MCLEALYWLQLQSKDFFPNAGSSENKINLAFRKPTKTSRNPRFYFFLMGRTVFNKRGIWKKIEIGEGWHGSVNIIWWEKLWIKIYRNLITYNIFDTFFYMVLFLFLFLYLLLFLFLIVLLWQSQCNQILNQETNWEKHFSIKL